jgi:hypothetical protein
MDSGSRDRSREAASSDGRDVYAHTNPVFLAKGGKPASSPEDARYFLKWIDTVLGLLEKLDRFDTPSQKQEVMAVWRKARDVYAGLAQESDQSGAPQPSVRHDAKVAYTGLGVILLCGLVWARRSNGE